MHSLSYTARHSIRRNPHAQIAAECDDDAIQCAAQVLLAYRALVSTLRPLGLDAEATRFSEARALQHVERLTEGGQGRLVGHPSIDAGIHYLAAATQDIVSLADSRHDLHVEVSNKLF